MSQETRTGALDQPRKVESEGGSKRRGYMYIPTAVFHGVAESDMTDRLN